MANAAQRTAADWLNNESFSRFSAETSDLQKTVLTFILALLGSMFVGTCLLLLLLIPVVAFLGFTLFTLILTVAVSYGFAGWLFLVNGYFRNGNLENSTGGIGGQFTSWIQPSGSSWWIPRRLGGSREKPLMVDVRELDRTRSNGKQLTKVVTSDGADSEVSYYARYKLIDMEKARNVRDLDQAYQSILDRGARTYVGHWDADPGAENAISSVKRKYEFSRFLEGAKDVVDRDGNTIDNDIAEKVAELGLETDAVKVDDINPPPELIKARTEAIREQAEADKEEKNIKALRNQTKKLKGRGKSALDISDEQALRAAQVARGDIKVVVVEGNAGDFTKGHVAAGFNLGRDSK